jgi:hypothetical protein
MNRSSIGITWNEIEGTYDLSYIGSGPQYDKNIDPMDQPKSHFQMTLYSSTSGVHFVRCPLSINGASQIHLSLSTQCSGA